MSRITPQTGGISAENRQRLELLHRAAGDGPVDARTASRLWDLPVPAARERLGYLARRGWLTRARRGLYLPVPLEAQVSGEWTDDPWVVASKAFAPCYIGGWSACEYWELTDQLFRDVVVITARKVRYRHTTIQKTSIRLKVLPQTKLFGTRLVWRDRSQVSVSDPSRTIVDVLDDPVLGGGITHVASVLTEYFKGPHRDDELLVDYAKRLGNRTVFKRLGFLIEALEIDARPVVEACFSLRSKGLTQLDPSVDSPGRIVRRWSLRVNVNIGPEVAA
jgi:predicted transcriptional regulator of viral defense system